MLCNGLYNQCVLLRMPKKKSVGSWLQYILIDIYQITQYNTVLILSPLAPSYMHDFIYWPAAIFKLQILR